MKGNKKIWRKQKILIVDDAEFNRNMLKEILEETFQMIGDNSGIDLMLLDINMPQMNGFEVLEIMKKGQRRMDTSESLDILML